ncbi:MAG: hypothetical protein FJX75_27620 [Armatimonadetes bacterium]|nr:hypothetical protein [Armatimonadota bacterium]
MGHAVMAGLAVLATTPTTAQDVTNLLTNPGFEALDEAGWAVGWEIWPGKLPEAGAVSVDSTVAHGGQRSLRLRHSNLGSYTRGQQAITLEPNQRYAFTVWVKSEGVTAGDGSMGARLYVEGIGGSDHATEATFGTSGWRQLTVGPHDSGAGGRITVMCYLHQASGTAWFDDLQAFKVTPEWERGMERLRLQKGLEATLHQAEDAAREAGDQTALNELAAVRTKAAGLDLPPSTDFRRGPPFTPLEGEVFAVMARLNARRLDTRTPVVAWVVEPFASPPPLGLAPIERKLSSSPMAGANEREQATLNLCNLSPETVRLSVSCSGFGNGGPAVTLREAVHVETQPGRLLADPLPRLRPDDRRPGAFLMELPPGVFRQLWCDIPTTDCPPGRYEARVRMETPGQEPIVWALSLRVFPVQFPDMAPIATWNYSYQSWELLQGRWEQARDDLTSHHINSYCWPADTLPWPQFDAAGALQPLDWTRFDKALADHGPVKWLLLWPGFEWDDNLRLRQGLEPGSEAWEQRFVAWFRALIAGLQERGFGYDRIAWYLADEPCSRPRAEAVRLAGEALHKADPQALIVENPYSAATQELLDLMAPVVDIWCPSLNWPQGDLLTWFQGKSKILWTYQVLSKDSDAFAAYRLSFWDCWRKGITGQGFWDYADCGGDNWAPYAAGRTNYAVVYGGDPAELVPSRRWEAWREGTEDYTYLWMLRRARPSSPLLDAGVAGLLAEPTPEALEALRSRVLQELCRQ